MFLKIAVQKQINTDPSTVEKVERNNYIVYI